LPVKLVAGCVGLALTSLGGKVSLAPPVGATIWAQPEVRTMIFGINGINRKKNKILFILICKHKSFRNVYVVKL
jgi:hypothetical protein